MSTDLQEIDAKEAQKFNQVFKEADLEIQSIYTSKNAIALSNTPEAKELKEYLEQLEKALPPSHAKTLFLDKIADDKIANRPAKIYCAVQALQACLNPSDAQKLDSLLQSLFNLAIQLQAASKGLSDEFAAALDTEQPESKSPTFLEKLFSTSKPEQKSISIETSRIDFLAHDGLSNKNITKKEELHRRDRLKKLQEARKIIGDDGLPGNSHKKDGYSTLTYLVLNGFYFLTRDFLSLNNPDLTHRDSYFRITALHWAAYKGDYLTVRYLLQFIPKEQVDFLNAPPSSGFGLTPLMAAAGGGYLDVVKLLLAAGARLDITDTHERNALNHASTDKQKHVVNFLKKFQKLGAPQKGASTPATDSKNQQKNDFLTPQQKSFLAFGEENPTGTLKEQEQRQEEAELIERMAHELIAAIKDSDHRKTKEILNPKQEPEIIKRIVSFVDNKDRTPWFYAVQEDNVEAMALLVQYGADVNRQDKQGKTALHWAAHDNNAEAIETLFSPAIQKQLKGTYLDIEKRDNDGDTALAIAAFQGSLEATVALLAAGANYQTENNYKSTPLHKASGEMYNNAPLNEKRRNVAKCLREFQETQPQELLAAAIEVGSSLADVWGEDAGRLIAQQTIAGYFNTVPTSFINKVKDEKSKKLMALTRPTKILSKTEKYGDDRWEHIREIKKRIDLGIDPNFSDERVGNILIYLILNGYLSLTHQVLQAAPNLIASQGELGNVLHWAALKGDPAIMRALLETLRTTKQLPLLINAKNSAEATPLMLAIDGGHFEAAKLLIAAGADFQIYTQQSNLPTLGQVEDQKGLNQLLGLWMSLQITGDTSQKRALIHGMFTDIIPDHAKHLFQEKESKQRFEQQCRERNSQELANALKDGDKEEVVRLTIPPKPAAKDKDVKETKEVTPPAPWFGFDPHYKDHNELTLLHLAAIAGDDKLVFNLIDKHKVNITTADKDGNTALHLAVFHDRSRVIETLLKADASLKNIPNSQGLTPLELAQAPEHPRLRAAHIIEHFKPKKPVAEAKGSEPDAETLAHEDQSQESAKSSGFMAGFARIFKKSKEEPKEKPKEEPKKEPPKKKEEPKPTLTSTTTSLN